MDNTEFTNALCRTLFHSLWQGLLIATAGGAVLWLTQRSRATLRYNLLSALLIIQVSLLVSTFIYEDHYSGYSPQSIQLQTQPLHISDGIISAAHDFNINTFINSNSRIIAGIWLAVLLLKMMRMTGILAYTRLVSKRKASNASPEWQERLQSLAARLQIRRSLTLLESAVIRVPAVFGHLKPVIFVPLGLLAQLPPGQAEAILLHELAHIRRNDYLVNLLQNVLESLLFFNPGIRWLSARLREEREHCCDDIAIGAAKDRRQYVAALISCKTFSQNAGYVPAFTGTRSTLLTRVRRIALHRNPTLSAAEKSTIAATMIIALLLLAIWSQPVRRLAAHLKERATVLSTAQPVVAARPHTIRSHHFVHAVKKTPIANEPPPQSSPKTYSRLEPMVADVAADLVQEKLLSDPAALTNLELSNTTLVVNGETQPATLHEKLRRKYLKGPPAGVDLRLIDDPHFGLYFNATTGFLGMGIRY